MDVVHRHATCTSTNDLAKELLLAGIKSGTTVRADTQTLGRGRSGRSWISNCGGLYFSIILRNIQSALAYRACFIAAQVLHQSFDNLGAKTLIKWPNDILFADKSRKKVCGILVEAIQNGTNSGLVVGVGINVRATPNPHENAGFLTDACPSLTIDTLFTQIEPKLFQQLMQIDNDQTFNDTLDYLRVHSATLNRRLKYEHNGQYHEGLAVDIAKDGALIIQPDTGERIKLYAGETHIINA